MLKKWGLRSIIGLLLLMLVVILTAPASLMKSQLTSQLPGTQFSAVSGKFLSGNFQQIRYQGVELKNLSWDVSLLSLFLADLKTNLTIDDTLFTGSLSIQRSLSGVISLTDIEARQSISELSHYSPPINALTPTGEIIWQDVNLSVDAETFSDASGEIQLNNLSINLGGQQFSLGSVKALPSIEQDDLVLTLSGDTVLEIQGTVRISRNRNYQLNISVTEQLPEQLYTALRYMARPDETGRLALNFSGRW